MQTLYVQRITPSANNIVAGRSVESNLTTSNATISKRVGIPASIESTGGWANNIGGLGLTSPITENSINDHTFIRSSHKPVGDTVRFKLDFPTGGTPKTLNYRFRAIDTGVSQLKLLMRLLVGDTEVASNESNFIDEFQTISIDLTNTQRLALLSDLDNIYLEFEADSILSGYMAPSSILQNLEIDAPVITIT